MGWGWLVTQLDFRVLTSRVKATVIHQKGRVRMQSKKSDRKEERMKMAKKGQTQTEGQKEK